MPMKLLRFKLGRMDYCQQATQYIAGAQSETPDPVPPLVDRDLLEELARQLVEQGIEAEFVRDDPVQGEVVYSPQDILIAVAQEIEVRGWEE